jgi:hypothetical protein
VLDAVEQPAGIGFADPPHDVKTFAVKSSASGEV